MGNKNSNITKSELDEPVIDDSNVNNSNVNNSNENNSNENNSNENDVKYTSSNAVELLEAITKGELKFDWCDINKQNPVIASQLRHFSKNTASPTEIFFGDLVYSAKHKQIPVVFKIFQKINNNNNVKLLALEYEIKAYKYITENILYKKLSPNFIGYVGSACCDSGMYNIIEAKRNTEIINSFKYGPFCMLVTEKAGLGSYFGVDNAINIFPLDALFSVKKNVLNPYELDAIVFQVVFALCVLEEFEIQHNDLHTANVLIAEYKEEIDLFFIFEGTQYKITTKYIPYIFDWDLSYVKDLRKNPFLESEKNTHTGFGSNKYENRDFYTFFCLSLRIVANIRSFSIFPAFNEMINKLYKTISAVFREKEEAISSFPVDEKIIQILNTTEPIGQENKETYYLLSGAQLVEITGYDDYKNISSAVVTLQKRPGIIMTHNNISLLLNRITTDIIYNAINTIEKNRNIVQIDNSKLKYYIPLQTLNYFISKEHIIEKNGLCKIELISIPNDVLYFYYRPCRRTVIDLNFPTPKQFLREFLNLFINDDDIHRDSNVYIFPKKSK